MDEYRKYEPIFGSWKLERLIGKGSFGKVFEISREEYGTTYRAALKIISVPQDDDDVKSRMAGGTDIENISEYYESILKEIVNENEIMSKLKGNSNIVSYEDHQIIPHEDGIGYDVLIRMELLTPLLDRMMQSRLDEKEVVKLGIDICKALELCHKKNIIHRDIKPQNIFVSENGDFKLGDFGIARTMEKTTGGMSKKGTYKYMAPEVFRGENYDSTVDIYSLGIVIYSLLNGNRGPFLPAPPAKVTHSDEEEARMRRFRGEEIPTPRDAGAMLTYIIKKACAANPAARYRSAEQMRADLESYLVNYGSQSEAALPSFNSEGATADKGSAPSAYGAGMVGGAGYDPQQYGAAPSEYRAGAVGAAGGAAYGGTGYSAPLQGYNTQQYGEAPREMPQQRARVAEVPKKKSKAWIVGLVAALVVAAAVAAFFILKPGDTAKDETASGGADTEFTPETPTEEDIAASMYDSYAGVLRDHESEIRAYSSQAGAPSEAVVITDISGDGVPELLFFEGEVSSQLRVYTYVDGDAFECDYDFSAIPDYNAGAGNDGLFTDAYVAGGTAYMIYTGKTPGEFYIAYHTSSGSTHCYSIRFKFEGDSTIVANKMLENEFGPNTQGPGEFDYYYLNGTEVDLNKGAAELKADREAFDRLLMTNGYDDDMKVFELTKKHKSESMTFDAALDKCEQQ